MDKCVLKTERGEGQTERQADSTISIRQTKQTQEEAQMDTHGHTLEQRSAGSSARLDAGARSHGSPPGTLRKRTGTHVLINMQSLRVCVHVHVYACGKDSRQMRKPQ